MAVSVRTAAWLALVLGMPGALLLPVDPGEVKEELAKRRTSPADLSAFAAEPPSRRLRLLFIHHSCGGQLLAAEGPSTERAPCIYEAHPSGGDLRTLLTRAGYEVHEASYGSTIGEATDLFDWLPKFDRQMERILTVDENDRSLPAGTQHDVVVFKSCFPNNEFNGPGAEPGSASGPELTVANAKATMRALLGPLSRHPNVLFVYVTAPPVAPRLHRERLWKVLARKLRGQPDVTVTLAERGAWARQFNDWVVSRDGWLSGYPHRNVVVFDYYDVLTGDGASNLSRFATDAGRDSHPSAEGNRRAAAALLPFLHRAVRRADLS